MTTMRDCQNAVGKWVQFRTRWGYHRGLITEVNQRAVLVKVPREYAPVELLGQSRDTDEEKLDVALAWGGFGGPGMGYPGGVGGFPGAGQGMQAAPGAGFGRWGYPGYGGWFGGWWIWWIAFAWIFWLAFLWW